MLAVKKVDALTGDDTAKIKSFLREVKTLGKIRHRHLVKLIGFCSHKGMNLLVYEYLANGSLWDRLHGPEVEPLTWETRYTVAIGVAEGIAYLHDDCVPQILHRDIKSNNILLDSRSQAHLGDFGLAKLIDTSGMTDSASTFAGSYGYMAPEYAYTMKATEKTDIYSFGVVLMELVTGKLPIDSSFPDGMEIATWVRSRIAKKASSEEVMDSHLEPFSHSVRLEMLLVLKVALLCTNASPAERPTMRETVDRLKQVIEESRSMSTQSSDLVDII
ncbi:hypothetical protein O6H91_Y510200 [Diphasiastrum complanatum]|nr:hypothetical protein O6H91_Y510200 [Diphasiastrum complanatum]